MPKEVIGLAINAGSVYSEMVLDISKYQRNLEKAEKQMNTFTTKLKSAGDKMQSAGKSLTTKLTLPIAAAGAASLKFGSDFEEGLNKVSTIADTTVKPIAEIKKGIIGLSDKVGVASTELSEALYQTISATGDTANSLAYVEVASKAAIGGFTDSATAVDGLTTVLNAYGLKGSKAMQKVSDQMLMAQNYGKTTFGEMASSIGNVIPIASSLNISTEELFGSIATLTKNGIQTSQAIIGLKAAYSNILKPSKEAGELAANLGLEFNAAHLKSVGWAKFLDEIRDKTGGNSEQLATLFGSVEALNSVTVLATTGSEDFAGALDAMGNSAGATEKAFAKMDQGTKDSMEDTLNKVKNLGIELADTLMPSINKLLDKVSGWIDKFRALDDGTKETIVKMAGLAAAIGPVLLVGGKFAKGAGSIIGLFGKFKGASAAATGATKLMAGGIGKAGLAAKAGALLLNPWTLGIAAATVGGIALYKHLQKDSIPAIELFGDKVSESTKKSAGGFLELNDKATLALNQLSWSGQTVTEEMTTNITNNFSQMASQVQAGLDKHHQESLEKIQGFVDNSTSLSEEEQKQILNNMQTGYENRKQTIADGEARIKEILDTASNEKRTLTKAEQEEINSIQREMVNQGIQVLSENEVEAKAIMERMKQQAGEMSARQAAEVVQNSLEQKQGAIEAANEQYNEVIKEIIRQRDESGTISEEQATKLIEEATRQRDETIDKATEMHNNVIEQAKQQAGEHVNQVDWETGEIKTKWQVMKTDISNKAKEIKDDVIDKWEEIKKNSSEKWGNVKTNLANDWKSMKENTVTKVKEIKNDVIDKWEEIRKSTAEKWGNVKESVSENIGTIKSKIGEGISKIKEWNRTKVKKKVFSIVNKVKNVFSSVGNAVSGAVDKVKNIGRNARGTNYWKGGFTWVGEEGPELIELPRTSKVYSNQKSMDMIKKASNLAASTDIIAPRSISQSNSNSEIDYDKLGKALAKYIKPSIKMENTFHSPKPLSPSETARKNLQISRQLAMEWGL